MYQSGRLTSWRPTVTIKISYTDIQTKSRRMLYEQV